VGFQFNLEGLLRVRESFEKQEEQKLGVAIAELKRWDAKIADVREQLAATAARLDELLARGAIGADIHLECYERHLLERLEKVLAESVSAARAEVKNQQIRLQAAQRKRKILDNLRQRQLALYLLTEGRRDQQRLDDTFLLRRAHRDSGKGAA